ncbi:nitroreductase [Burkholderia dolosa]|jgi:nitroreductase|uniref:nitroreductase n=1 Tax=Burkholderia dolosa TaxID=152500 RepID=UPI001591C620|nr:nitroreductase [Burkholderia dolosa]MBR8057380.1 nitroreductase [Burkholderia dolosa]MBR8459506.1 nitroreductase [Burkholderia dolosa]MBY4753058.1 nitroreductase [Burkholderia dolosa]MBY4830640.1 nitroreductase [Burkholderia dolosa]MDN7421744.1 nitroreductase [Burkholderia dolosa]
MFIDDIEATHEVTELEKIMMSRFANRFYLDREVDLAVVTGILDSARYAATGANVQPWRVHVATGDAKAQLVDALSTAHDTSPADHVSEYRYLPDVLPEPFASRRREFGAVFFGSLGIGHDDVVARAANTARNCRFFDAPVALIFTIDRRLEKGSWLDLGMFIQNVMLAAKARGLDTCTQEFLSRYHAVIRANLPLGAEEMVVCTMALGYGDPEWASRRPHMPKAPVDAFASFYGF